MIMNNERIGLGEWDFGDRLRTEKDPVKSQILNKRLGELRAKGYKVDRVKLVAHSVLIH